MSEHTDHRTLPSASASDSATPVLPRPLEEVPLVLTSMSARRPGNFSDRVRSLKLPVDSGKTSSQRVWLPWVLCLMFATSTAAIAFHSLRHPPESSEKPVDAATTSNFALPPPATVASSGEVVLESKGYVIPVHQIQVSPKVSGMVLKLNFREGMNVQAGTVLAELETTDYQAEYDRAVATCNNAWSRWLELSTGSRQQEIRQAKAELDESEAQREQLYLDWQRNIRLQGTAALAPREYEQAEASYKAMKRRVERLRSAYQLMVDGPRPDRVQAAWAEIEQAEADLAKACWRLDNCIVRAPVSGTILTKKAELGNIVNPNAFNISAALCDMADLSDLEAELTIQERDVARVFPQQRCRICPTAFPDRHYEGYVSRLMPVADRAKGAVPVRVKILVPAGEEGRYLRPDMSAMVSFLKAQR